MVIIATSLCIQFLILLFSLLPLSHPFLWPSLQMLSTAFSCSILLLSSLLRASFYMSPELQHVSSGSHFDSISQINDCEEIKTGEKGGTIALLERGLSFLGDKQEHRVCGCVCVSACVRKRGSRRSSVGHHNMSAYQPPTVRLHLRPPLTAFSWSAAISHSPFFGRGALS